MRCGDCLDQLQKLPDACVDLIYIDPPFNSNCNYEVFCGGFSEPSRRTSGLESGVDPPFEDRQAGPQAYIDDMRPRCVELARVLKKTGSFYYHCDWHASHYIKVMMHYIIGERIIIKLNAVEHDSRYRLQPSMAGVEYGRRGLDTPGTSKA